jgi:hypothetical protein
MTSPGQGPDRARGWAWFVVVHPETREECRFHRFWGSERRQGTAVGVKIGEK